MYRYRLCTESDFAHCAAFLRDHGHFACPSETWQRMPEVWSRWLKQDALNAVFWEDLAEPDEHRRRLGYGLSVAVSEVFAAQLQRQPIPYVGNALYAAPFGPHSPVLERRGIAEANAGDGLNVVMLHNPLRYTDVEHPVFRALMPHGMNAWYATHAGHYFKRIFWENYGNALADINRKGSFRDIADFSADPRFASLPEPARPILQIMQRPTGLDGVYAADDLWMFHRHWPLLKLTASQQRLLRYALDGNTDQELALRLALSPSTIKHTWRAVFARFEDQLPALLPALRSGDENQRGASKRHVVLEYLRQNLHELRPYA